jgi:hypothetical protein
METLNLAEALQSVLTQLSACLSRWQDESDNIQCTEIHDKLSEVDLAWADFEREYISELMRVEDSARQVIRDAIQQEQRLQELEGTLRDPIKSAEYRKELGVLVKQIAKMNAAANSKGKGRDDLRAGIYFSARAILEGQQRCDRRCDVILPNDRAEKCAAEMLAAHVVKSFEGMRRYLRSVSTCVDHVDPLLGNNAGLVAHLVDWEESWEMGSKYVQNRAVLHSVVNIVSEVKSAQKSSPNLVDMCDSCDPELFMVLPRMVWMQFLANPQQVVELFKTLLPKRFEASEEENPKQAFTWDADIEALMKKFSSVESKICGNVAWEILIKRIVSGESCKDAYSHLPSTARQEAERAVEDFVHELEGYSIELQRVCPDDWNQCSAILVWCLNGGSPERKQEEFRV